MRHVIVTRFSVPRLDAATAARHADPSWLGERLALFRTWFVPSVRGLEVPVILLCSSRSAGYVSEKVRDLSWASIVVQDDWYGGWRGAPEQTVTRLDSDDAVRQDIRGNTRSGDPRLKVLGLPPVADPVERGDDPALVAAVHESVQAGHSEIGFYADGLLPASCLDWVRQAIRYARRES